MILLILKALENNSPYFFPKTANNENGWKKGETNCGRFFNDCSSNAILLFPHLGYFSLHGKEGNWGAKHPRPCRLYHDW